jgi:hypothetical protein
MKLWPCKLLNSAISAWQALQAAEPMKLAPPLEDR